EFPKAKDIVEPERLIGQRIEYTRVGQAHILPDLDVSPGKIEPAEAAGADHEGRVVELAAAVEESARAQVVLAECTVLVVGIVIERYPGIGPGEVPLLPPASSYGDIVPVGHVFRDPEAVDVLRL